MSTQSGNLHSTPDPSHPPERAIVEWDNSSSTYTVYSTDTSTGITLKQNLEYWISEAGRRVLGNTEVPERVHHEEVVAHLQRRQAELVAGVVELEALAGILDRKLEEDGLDGV